MDTDKILLKTHLYHCMILVDKILGYSVTKGIGTSQDTIMVDVDKAMIKVERLQNLCRNLVGEEILYQNGQYETEMQRLAAEVERLRAGVQCILDDDLSTKRVRHNRDTAIQYAQATASKLLAAEAVKEDGE